MRKVRRRLQAIEQLSLFQTPPSPLPNLAQSAGGQPRELSQGEVAACAGWAAALEIEARRLGFRSYAAAEQSMGRRR